MTSVTAVLCLLYGLDLDLDLAGTKARAKARPARQIGGRKILRCSQFGAHVFPLCALHKFVRHGVLARRRR